jgi:hypothetical protein
LPLYSRDKDTGWGIDGFKLRALFAVPKAEDRTFFLRREFRVQLQRHAFGHDPFTPEIPRSSAAPEADRHIVNPIVDTAYDGSEILNSCRRRAVAYNFQSGWAAALEEYDDFGPVHRFLPASEQVHQIYGVVDRTWKAWEIEAGVGIGMTASSDSTHAQLILARDSSTRRRRTDSGHVPTAAAWRSAGGQAAVSSSGGCSSPDSRR